MGIEPNIDIDGATLSDYQQAGSPWDVFAQGLKIMEDNEKRAYELFEESFEGMLQIALDGDESAQHNIAILYLQGVGEPYEDDHDTIIDWVIHDLLAEEDLQMYHDEIEEELHRARNNDEHGASDEAHDVTPYRSNGGQDAAYDRGNEAEKKLRRLYLLKRRLELQGYATGANRDESYDIDE